MAARKVRRVFATPFVITVAANGCSKGESPMRMYQVTTEHRGVHLVEETCPTNIECKVRPPFAYLETGYRMRKNVEVHAHPTREGTYLYAEVDGQCYMRPNGCTKRDCLTDKVACIERPTAPVPIQAWAVKVAKGSCEVTPEPPSSLSPKLPAYTMPCPAELSEDGPYIVSVVHDGDATGRCEAREDYECEPGASCNPPPPIKLACPAK